MPLIVLARLALSLASLAILGAAGYLLWSWREGYWVLDAHGVGHRMHEPRRPWTAVALLAWSLLGRFVMEPLLAKPDTGSHPARAWRPSNDHQPDRIDDLCRGAWVS